jgi:hypothetical protein
MAGIGFGAVTIGGNSIDNYKVAAGNGLGPKTHIVALTREDSGNLTQANLDDFASSVTLTGGVAGTAGLPAFVVAGIAGAVGDATVHFALQGTATFTTDTDDAYGVTGLAATLVATFDQA